MAPSYGFDIFYKWGQVGISLPTPLLIGLPIILVILCFAYFVYFKENEKKNDDIFNPNIEHRDLNSCNFDPLSDGPQHSADRSKGLTSKYKWTQNVTEVEMFVFIPDNTRAKDVLLDILTTGIVLTVAGQVLLDGDFYDDVVPSDCNWQLDDDEGKRVIWITIQKKIPTQQKDFWKTVFSSEHHHDNDIDQDDETLMGNEYPTDPIDTAEFHKALNQMKKKSS